MKILFMTATERLFRGDSDEYMILMDESKRLWKNNL